MGRYRATPNAAAFQRGRFHREMALEVERLQIVRAVPDEVRQRQVSRALGHVGVLAAGECFEEPKDAAESRGRDAAEAERRAAGVSRQPLLVVPAHLRRLEGGVVRDARGSRDP